MTSRRITIARQQRRVATRRAITQAKLAAHVKWLTDLHVRLAKHGR